MLATIADKDKDEAVQIFKRYSGQGFSFMATSGTAAAFRQAGIQVEQVNKLAEGSPNIIDLIREDKIDFVVNTLTKGRQSYSDGFWIRRTAVEHGVPCLTSLDTVRVILQVIEKIKAGEYMEMIPLQQYLGGRGK